MFDEATEHVGAWEDLNEDGKIASRSKFKFLQGMGSCHQITRVDGKMIGDPLDIKMFEASNFKLIETMNEETKENDTIVEGKTCDLQILKAFEFSSSLQRMSVLCDWHGKEKLRVFVKGSPEKIRELCNEHSVPFNFHDVLFEYA